MAEQHGTISSPKDTTDADQHWQVLAGWRFALAMIVVSGHLSWFAPGSVLTLPRKLGGTAAVLGFLLVSGYSIAHSLYRRPRGFYARRLLRIYPIYGTAVLFSLVPFWTGADALRTATPLIVIVRPHAWGVLGNLLMLQNLICLPITTDNMVWTLGIEVICYALAPWLWRSPTAVLLGIVAISAAMFGAYPRTGWAHYATLRGGLPLLMFTWAWVAGLLLHRYRSRRAVGATIALLAAAMVSINHQFESPVSVIPVLATGLLITFASRIRLPAAAGRVFNYLGDLSYPLYLLHMPTFVLSYCVLRVNGAATLLLCALAVSAAFLWIESVLKPIVMRTVPRRDVPSRPEIELKLSRESGGSNRGATATAGRRTI